MDELLLDISALRLTFTAFRDLIEYHVVSHDTHATGTRAQLRQSANGGDAFLSSLCQDLDDVCTHCSQTNNPTAWDDSARGDLRNLLSCLSGIIAPHDPPVSPAERLEDLREQTRSWDYRNLREDQRHWLKQHVRLQQLSPALRKTIIRRSATASRLLDRGSEDHGDDDDAGIKDVWALNTAVKLSEPLRSVHEAFFQQWDCNCHSDHEHSRLLVSYATPCHNLDTSTNCLLRFTTSHEAQVPWSTVFLDITNNCTVQRTTDALSQSHSVGCLGLDVQSSSDLADGGSSPLRCLHDRLVRISKDDSTSATLKFCSQDKSWTVTPDLTDDSRPYSMVSLTSLMADDATHPLREEPYHRRVSLALIVTYAFLQLGNSPWFPCTLNDINIRFHKEDGAAPILLQPFLEIGLAIGDDLVEGQNKNHTILRMINPDMPCLPVLGKLILELISGCGVELDSVEKFMMDYRHQYPERAPYVWGAVRPCFFDNTFKAESMHNNELLRVKFLEEVVYRLHKLLSQCKKSLEGEISQMTPAPALNSKKRQRRSSANPRMAKRPSLSPSGPMVGTTTATSDLGLVSCLHDDGSQHPFDQEQAEQARSFMLKLQEFHDFLPSGSPPPVRVAILDTGLHLGARTWKLYRSKVVETRSWLGDEPACKLPQQGSDSDGHGTHCATAFLQCAHDACELFIGQVLESRERTSNDHPGSTDDAARVAQAIRYAVEVWNVDIISMSFGYESTVEVIDDALKFAGDSNVLLIAAASNVGGNTGRARRWPGTRDNVLSMCATEGNGFEYKGNPPPRENGFNFATLGVMVPVWTVPNGFDSSNQVYRSGTSISTPIAAAIAAAVIELIRHTEEQYVSQHLERERGDVRSRVNRAKKSALQASGMGKIFSLMAQKTGRYDYVQPTNLLTRYMTPMKLLDKILDKLDE